MVYYFTVAGLLFELADKDVIGSRTIGELLAFPTVSALQPIPLEVDLNDWYEYLAYLSDKANKTGKAGKSDKASKTNKPDTFGSLRMIDYLDNVTQARQWCQRFWQQQKANLIGLNSDAVIEEDIGRQLKDILNTYTAFDIDHVAPLSFFHGFTDILARINSPQPDALSADDVKHIVMSLFSKKVIDNYQQIGGRSLDILEPRLIDISGRSLFIFMSSLGPYIHKVDNAILHDPPVDYFSSHADFMVHTRGQAAFISERVAQHYPDINLYDVGNREMLIYCPDDKPYVDCAITLHPNYTQVYVTASLAPISGKVWQSTLVKRCSKQEHPTGNYTPRQGYLTDLKITDNEGGPDYDLISYNPLSTYGRDYYLLLPYEYDPVIRVIYAFSV